MFGNISESKTHVIGAKVNAYDPVAINEAKHHFGDTISYFNDQYEALIDADCLAVLTEWPEFKIPNFNIISRLLNAAVLFDGRNIYDKEELFKNGFDYFCIGINTSKLALKAQLSEAV